MNSETQQRLKIIEDKLLHMLRYLDLASKEARIKELEAFMEKPSFWENHEKAQLVIEEANSLKAWIVPYQNCKQLFCDLKELLPEAYASGDEALVNELVQELDGVEKKLNDLEIRKMLAGELDNKNCYLSINSGAGGTEACDWALMLSRMYQRWAVKRGWKVELIDRVEGDVAGIKSITFKFDGEFAYGYAKAEKGVHRLVRISPFDANAKRHTSFASVDVTPEITDDIVIDIKPEEIRVDTYRASGAGGQHVNKTDSAVRMTHLPTGIVVSSQTQRSQVQNRESCHKMLRSKLYEKEVTERENALKALSGEKKEIAWGSQIRNYVFQPYTLVKDTRTKHESGDIQAVMNGELDDFVNAYLKEFE
ncbi:peptide chain release factor 2 [Neochlamydia sp. TUME1]|uniref:peptide chain release factor 2 n=1 Tax=Neochlamydia sp. TUME1 TaxID=1478174 RepID=UPI001930EA66|nr:peptide chain release factor 2 [Neochlamydia sp. TUME1]